MPTNLLTNLLTPGTALVIQNTTTPGAAIAPSLAPVKVLFKFTSSLCKHLQEDGSTLVDARIIQPTVIEIEAYCPDTTTATQINNFLLDRSSLYSVASRGITVNDMMPDTEQVKQSPDVMSAVPIRISMKQVITNATTPTVVAQSSDSSLIDKGMTLLNTVTTSVSSLVSTVENSAASVIGGL